jgi:glyoxylase I family protein
LTAEFSDTRGEADMATIEHFAVYGDDPTALKDFYVGTFGMRVIFDNGKTPPGYFLADDAGFAIEVLARPAGTPGVDQRWVCHLAFWVEDVLAKKAELESLGFTFETETFVDNNEMKTAFFQDPGGNRCQIVWRRKPLGS